MQRRLVTSLATATIAVLAFAYWPSNEDNENRRFSEFCNRLNAGDRAGALAVIPKLVRGRAGLEKLLASPWEITSCKAQGEPSLANSPGPWPLDCKEWMKAVWLESKPVNPTEKYPEGEVYFKYGCSRFFGSYSRLQSIEARINQMTGSGRNKTLWSWEEL